MENINDEECLVKQKNDNQWWTPIPTATLAIRYKTLKNVGGSSNYALISSIICGKMTTCHCDCL